MTPLERWLAQQMLKDRARDSALNASSFFHGANGGRIVARYAGR